ncbi:MAG: hypothetical protein HFE63_01835 [Clostridiales bacterium]|nr:hypothetical protein [Clostridiales bacterium]
MKFPGETFTFLVYSNAAAHNEMTTDEQNGDTLNDAIYQRKMRTEERLGCNIEEIVSEDGEIANTFRTSVMSGTDEFNVANVRCTDALTFWEDGLTISVADLPYVDITKNYWNKSFNDSLTLSGQQYIAIGDMNISTHDLTYALLFNKQLIEDYSLESPYDLVRDGKWTSSKMAEMMKVVTNDLNNNGEQDESDMYGYVANGKQVLPNFWIAAGELSVTKDENDLPKLNLESERFYDVFIKTFEIMYDDANWYTKFDQSQDVPPNSISIFSENRALFMDCSLKSIEAMRSMETDFGIIPYPKFDEAQDRYYSRVSYYNAPIVPKSLQPEKYDFTGAVLEYFNYESSITVIPAYIDVALKAKGTRDDESLEMLELIFESRMVDIGDTTLCGDIRDGAMSNLFNRNNRDLASKIPSLETVVKKYIEKIPDEYK